MMGKQSTPEELFYRFRLENHVPADHPLRAVDAVLDLSRARKALAEHYSHTGRPSIDPELMLRMLLIGYAHLSAQGNRNRENRRCWIPVSPFPAMS